MGIVTNALNILPALMSGSYDFFPGSAFIGIGTGSATFISGALALITEVDRNPIDTSDLSTTEEVTYTANWTPIEISGLVITEHGTFQLGSAMLNREQLTGSLVFDGESELQVQQTFKFYI